MVDQTAIVLGVGVSSFLLFYLSNSFGDGDNDLLRQVLKLLSIGFGVMLLMVIPQTLLTSQVCDVVVNNTTMVGANVTSYGYMSFCYEETNQAMTGFYKVVLVFFRVFVFVLLLRVAWLVLQAFMLAVKKRVK